MQVLSLFAHLRRSAATLSSRLVRVSYPGDMSVAASTMAGPLCRSTPRPHQACLGGSFGVEQSALLRALRACYSTSRDTGLKKYKPMTPGLRGRIITTRKDLWKGGPFKPLTEGLTKSGGRNNHGRITSRHRGGGHKRVYRKIDFARRVEIEGVVQRLEYDPNRSARIALLHHAAMPEGTPVSRAHSYVLAPQDIVAGQVLTSGEGAAIRPGNSLPLRAIPIGMQIHNIEMQPGRGGQLARAAGTSCTLVKKGNDGYATIKLPSGEQKLVLLDCMATVGVLSNPQHKNRKLGKAGASRWLGRRPVVRGVAMNAVDHPHGGGRGKSKGRISQTPWGKPTKGYRTRNNKRTDWTIVKRRYA